MKHPSWFTTVLLIVAVTGVGSAAALARAGNRGPATPAPTFIGTAVPFDPELGPRGPAPTGFAKTPTPLTWPMPSLAPGPTPTPRPSPTDQPPFDLIDKIMHEALRPLVGVPGVGLSPDAFGVTGLATWFWHDPDEDLVLTPVDHDDDPTTPPVDGIWATTVVNDRTAVVDAWIEEYRWELSNGTVLRSHRGGSADDPAAEHTWRTKDPDAWVRMVVIWTGRWELASSSGTMAPLEIRAERAYPVREIRAVPAD